MLSTKISSSIFLILFSVLYFSTVSIASKIYFTSKKSVVTLALNNYTGKNASYSIKSHENEFISSKTIDVNENLREEIDFSAFEEGEYLLEVNLEGMKINKKVRLSSRKKVSVISNNYSNANKSFTLNVKRGKLNIKTTQVLSDNFTLEFYNLDEDLLYTNTFLARYNSMSSMDLSTLGNSRVIMNIIFGETTYQEYLFNY
ncbi:hypothetical protein [Flammeovirga kamogawensis]|uniref:Uncharacterized protein n=1 Tax=Flammeovirga kamogawensis TaxID=373891 RepID=A0ABX8GZE6_9BACT|nr:hypothetical protein [Flammeovirga kamogawensis]MBB6459229.1 hypothetical protein [Flammeovirga kamogawensis]QWG08793.1 hypothetical protein KM029_07580 [Flammeovirga kamogawensis]TRX67083.1 hypothetical protein EO216_02625 [Flammeovirga kamogawensis]